MEKRQNFSIHLLISMGLFLMFASSCEKNDGDNNGGIPVLATTLVTHITPTTAISGGKISHGSGTDVTSRGVCWSTSQNPTVADNKTTDGSGHGNFISHISGLSKDTKYYIRAYAINSLGTGYGQQLLFTTPDTFTDPRDGAVYKTIAIGTQVWLAENLKYLPSVAGTNTNSAKTPSYYVYDYYGTNVAEAKATVNYSIYGVLYNWEAAKSACPDGWRLPTDAEWTTLENFLGGSLVAGAKLKEEGEAHWNNPNVGSTNSSGFTALPGGFYQSATQFGNLTRGADFWSLTQGLGWGNARSLYHNNSYVGQYQNNEKTTGFSVRCLKN